MSTTIPHTAEHATADSDPLALQAGKRPSLLRWIVVGGLGAAVLAAVALAAWPASQTDKAREDGRAYGEAVAAVHDARTPAEVDAALAGVHTATSDTRNHTGEAVADHVAAQENALARAAEGFVGAHVSDDALEVDLYRAELDVALDDLTEEASDFGARGPEVQQAFWDGFQEAMPST
jgi:hypothetical protein